MLGTSFGLAPIPSKGKGGGGRPLDETATPDTVLWIKDGFGDEQIDFGLWNQSHEMGYFDGKTGISVILFGETPPSPPLGMEMEGEKEEGEGKKGRFAYLISLD